MACSKTLSINPASTGDMALDQAIYEPNTGFIFGVRGQWVFKFSPADGSLISSMRFTDQVNGKSCITNIAGKLYIGTTFSPHIDASSFTAFPKQDIYIVDAASFTSLGGMGLGTAHLGALFFGARIQQYWANGWFLIGTDGTKLLGHNGDIFRVDPSNIPGYVRSSYGPAYDLCYDADHNVMWVVGQNVPEIDAFTASDFTQNTFNSGTPSFYISGITYCHAQQKIYFVQGDFNIGMIDASNIVAQIAGSIQFAFTTFNTGRINATPFRVKAVNNLVGNPHNGKVLIPTWGDDSVVIWNPLTDAVDSVLTGFTAPFDIVVCPTTNFAVCTGPTGLQKIT